MHTDDLENKVTIRNPQIVNGAQTITQLFKAWDAEKLRNNPAKLLVRLYRLPYEDSETYKRSIDIITALNSQNKIKSSDLRSTDPRQVLLENRISDLGRQYTYIRKRSELAKIATRTNIFMTKLAHSFYSNHFGKPDEGIAGQIESFFEEEKRYEDCFPVNQIKKTVTQKPDHIIFKYIGSWLIGFIIDKNLPLNKKHEELYGYIRWYLFADVYEQHQRWKEQYFSGTWREALDFIESNEIIDGIIKYCKVRYPIYFGWKPSSEADPRTFYKSVEGRKRFKKNSGSFNQYKREINRVYELFRKRNDY